MQKIIVGDCVEVMARGTAASIDAIVTDPPYGLEFMGKGWDKLGDNRQPFKGEVQTPDNPYGRTPIRFTAAGANGLAMQAWHQAWATEAQRVLKPGGYLLAFGGTRTFHRLACAIEDAGFEIRDCLSWLYGQGFPKSRNLHGDHEGWGTALKPAWEPIIMARKPLIGTVAANVLAHGTGAINVDASRIGTRFNPPTHKSATAAMGSFDMCEGEGSTVAGRWPANVVLDEEAGAMLDEQSGESKDGVAVHRNGVTAGGYGDWAGRLPKGTADQGFGGKGGASRFFYCAKASTSERSAGLDQRNSHPTVKPIALMSWLIKMVTPPGGIVLDPFLGSGTTALAAAKAGFQWVGIEQDPEYAAIAEKRLSAILSA